MRFLTRHLKNYLWICRLRLPMQRANQLWRLLLIMARPMALLSLMIVLSSARKLVTPPLWRLWNSKIRTGGAFLFDNILLLRSWAFEGFSNYQVSRSWAKIKKNKRVCTDTTMFTVMTQLRSKHQNHVVSFLVYVVGGCTNIYAML